MMGLKIKSREYSPIGLDIGHNSIKMVQLYFSDGTFSIAAADKVRVENGSDAEDTNRNDVIISAVKKMLANGSFRGADVIFSLPSELLKITSLRLRQAETESIDQLISKEAESRFNLKSQVDTINYKLAGTVRQGEETLNEYILFGSDDQTLRSQIQIIEKAGLRPIGIDPIPCAIYRCFGRFIRRQEDREQAEILVDVGSKSSTVIFGRDGDISFIKNIHFGTLDMNQEIASRLGISAGEAEMLRCRLLRKNKGRAQSNPDDKAAELQGNLTPDDSMDASTQQTIVDAISLIAEKVAKEISLCFRYYTVTFRGKRAQRATIAGGGAYEGILINVLRRHLAVDVMLAQPFCGIDMADANFNFDKRSPNSEWAVAVGLGLKGANVNNAARQAVKA